jgi:hypothetical protein
VIIQQNIRADNYISVPRSYKLTANLYLQGTDLGNIRLSPLLQYVLGTPFPSLAVRPGHTFPLSSSTSWAHLSPVLQYVLGTPFPCLPVRPGHTFPLSCSTSWAHFPTLLPKRMVDADDTTQTTDCLSSVHSPLLSHLCVTLPQFLNVPAAVLCY